jgi:hypothetical protein
MMNYLHNWVNTWKPAIDASIKSERALYVDTMGCMDDGHICYLVPPPKCHPRSVSGPAKLSHATGWKRRKQKEMPESPRFVYWYPITDYFTNILQHITDNTHTTPETT